MVRMLLDGWRGKEEVAVPDMALPDSCERGENVTLKWVSQKILAVFFVPSQVVQR